MCDHLCPIMTCFAATGEILDDFGDLHSEPRKARGYLALNKKVAEEVRASYPCDGPNLDQNGNVHCPLSALISDVFSMSAYQFHPLAVDPEKLIDADRKSITGAYL